MRTFAIAALLCSVALPAHAGISCNMNDQRNNTLSYTFARGGQGYTNEISVRRNGVIISNGGPTWSRSYNRAQKIMTLEQAGWAIAYEAHATEAETSAAVLYHGGNRVAIGTCYADHSMDTPAPTYTAPEPAPTYTAPDPTPAPTYRAPAPTYTAPPLSPSFTVALNDIPGVAAVQYINVSFGNNTIYAMTLDTGCSSMTVSPAVADWLIANNKGTEMSAMNNSYADGSIHTSRHIMVNMISIAGHIAYNVEAGVVAPGQNYGDMLIGLSVLQRFGKFTIDSANHQLTFG